MTKTPYTEVTSEDLTTATIGETKSYTYDTTWTDKLTSFGGESIVYDEIGNPTTYRGATLTWDGRQLMSYSKDGTNISYQYDADGLRTKQLIYDGEGRISIEITYLWDNGQLVGYTSTLYDYSAETGTTSNSFDVKVHYDEASEPYAVTLDEETYYYIRNAVGDVKGLINADTGEYVYALHTSAYGVLEFAEPDLSFNTSSIIPDQMEAILNSMVKAILQFCLCLPSANTYKGYSFDVFTGLYYLQSRYYDPEVGRFINADDTDFLGTSDKPLSYNLFAYCENNPVNNSDPLGQFSIKVYAIAALTSALISAVTQLIKNYKSGCRGKNLFKGVIASSIGSSVNTVLSMKLIRLKTKGIVISALAAGFVQALIETLIEILVYKNRSIIKLSTSALYSFVLNSAYNLAGNYLGGRIIKINSGWYQPKNIRSFFLKSYGKRLIAQTGISSAINTVYYLIIKRVKSNLNVPKI